MVRRADDTTDLSEDLEAIEGSLFLAKCTQLVFNGDEMTTGTAGTIKDPVNGTTVDTPDDYPEAVIAFEAEFYVLPSKSYDYITGQSFKTKFNEMTRPAFTRNLAVRR